MKEFEEYNREDAEEFKQHLFEHYGVTDNPKREECYRLAYEYGHSSGYREIDNYFCELVELIK